ncbi:MAG: DUF721 domain-containing protein [Candidatus Lambdaproteobacteria bacterium]|nr:DUF721 domain-containing protein [Candidatus Lambdaproteobacteria bacterium]
MAGDRPQELHELVQALFREQQKQPHLTLNLLRQHWSAIVGETLGATTRPLRLEKGVLWVGARDASWAYQLQFMKADLLASVATFLEGQLVRDMRFRAVPAEETAAAPPVWPAPAARPPAPEPPAAPAGVVRAAQAIGDPRLRERFVRALSRRPRGDSTPDPEPDSR